MQAAFKGKELPLLRTNFYFVERIFLDNVRRDIKCQSACGAVVVPSRQPLKHAFLVKDVRTVLRADYDVPHSVLCDTDRAVIRSSPAHSTVIADRPAGLSDTSIWQDEMALWLDGHTPIISSRRRRVATLAVYYQFQIFVGNDLAGSTGEQC